MPTHTIHANVTGVQGYINSYDGSWSVARAGTATLAAFDNSQSVLGYQMDDRFSGRWRCFQGFLRFDTSVVPDGETITSAKIVAATGSATSFMNGPSQTMRWRFNDWGTTVEAADWVHGDNLTALPLFGEALVENTVAVDDIIEFPMVAGAETHIDKTGYTEFIGHTALQESTTNPPRSSGNLLRAEWATYPYNGASPPYLVIETSASAVDVEVLAVPATASASAPAPTAATTSDASIQATPATATAEMLSPPWNETITAPTSSASADAVAPTVEGTSDAGVVAPVATAPAAAPAPVIRSQEVVGIGAVTATATASMPVPGSNATQPNASVEAPVANAGGAMYSPVIDTIKSPTIAALVKTAAAAMLPPSSVGAVAVVVDPDVVYIGDVQHVVEMGSVEEIVFTPVESAIVELEA